jgi:hypothetical protein
MVTDDNTGNTNRPYAPSSNVIAVLQKIRSRNLVEKIETEYLRDIGISEGTIARTLFAMRFLGLTDESGLLLPPLKAMHTATDEEYRTILAGLIRESYKEIFSVVDPSEVSQEKILNIFRRYTPASQRDRMVVFFLGMCREAGIPTLDVPKSRAMTTKSAKGETKLPNIIRIGARTSSLQRARGNQSPPSIGLNPALEGLIKTLPAPGEALSQERRSQWLKMAEATLAFVYPENVANTDVPSTKEESQDGHSMV